MAKNLSLVRHELLFLEINDTAKKKGEITEVSTEAYEKLSALLMGHIAFANLGKAKAGEVCPMCLEGTVEVLPHPTDPKITEYFCRGGCEMTTGVGEGARG